MINFKMLVAVSVINARHRALAKKVKIGLAKRFETPPNVRRFATTSRIMEPVVELLEPMEENGTMN